MPLIVSPVKSLCYEAMELAKKLPYENPVALYGLSRGDLENLTYK